MTRSMPVILILLATLATGLVHAQPESAASYITAGKQAFDAGHYPEAIAAYEKAYRLQPDPLTLCRIAIAAGYVKPLSDAFPRLEAWLASKRQAARAQGDSEPSWDALDSVVNAYRAAVALQEQETATLRARVSELEAQVATVTKIKDTIEIKARLDREQLEHRIEALTLAVETWRGQAGPRDARAHE